MMICTLNYQVMITLMLFLLPWTELIMNKRLDMFLSLTRAQRGLVAAIFFTFFILPGYAMFSVANSPKANRVLGQVESMLITDVDNTVETMRLF